MADVETKDVPRIFNAARHAIRESVFEGYDSPEADEQVRQFNHALSRFEQDAWHRGWDLGASIATRQAEDHVELLLQVAASLKGKDRGDGIIRFEVYPDPDIYDRGYKLRRAEEERQEDVG